MAKYVVVKQDTGISGDEWIMWEGDDLSTAKKEARDFYNIKIRDNQKDEIFLAVKEDWEDGNYDEIEFLLKNIRERTGLNQTKFAKKFGIPLRTYQSWENGEKPPKDYVIDMIGRIVELESINKEM